MKTPSIAPPVIAPAANRAVLPLAFNLASLVVESTNILLLALSTKPKYLPAFLDVSAVCASLVPTLKPIPPGTPILTNSSVIFPAVVAAAFSSKVVRSSNHFSTAAALLVSAPRSMSVAPKEKIPLGI